MITLLRELDRWNFDFLCEWADLVLATGIRKLDGLNVADRIKSMCFQLLHVGRRLLQLSDRLLGALLWNLDVVFDELCKHSVHLGRRIFDRRKKRGSSNSSV